MFDASLDDHRYDGIKTVAVYELPTICGGHIRLMIFL